MIIKTELDEMLPYTEDPSNIAGSLPSKIYIPETVAEVAPLVRQAYVTNTPLTISGGGTGIVGGRIPRGGWVLSTERLQKIHPFEIAKNTIQVEAGVVINTLLNTLATFKYFYPPFPTEKTAYIGGTIATNASGEYTYRYGPTRAHIQSLNVVLAHGQMLTIHRGDYSINNGVFNLPMLTGTLHTTFRTPNVPKSSCGYFLKDSTDLVDLLIGSEGTLAVITGAELSLIPAPHEPFFCVIFLNTATAFALSNTLKSASFEPSILGIEYFDHHSLELLRLKHTLPTNATEALLVMFNIEDESIYDAIAPYLEHPDIIDTWASDSAQSRERIYAFRHALPEAVNDRIRSEGLTKLSTDCAVPHAQAATMLTYYKELLSSTDIPYTLFGHIGEAHLHVNFLPKPGQKDQAKKLYKMILQKAVSLGGTISAEHGIGKKKAPYLPLMFSKNQLHEMKKIKNYFDPKGILCPGNIF